MKLIPLTQGQFAKVDDNDYVFLMQWKWRVLKGKNTFYAVRTTYKKGKVKCFLMHREIMGTKDVDAKVDHKYGDGLNNERYNLRQCSNAQNMWNVGNVLKREGSTSKYKGVSFINKKNRWKCQIKDNNTAMYLGIFRTETEAALKYNEAATKLRGEFARLNIIDVI